MDRLSTKVAVITGAAQGMGSEHGRQFVAEGAKVILTDINQQGGEALAQELGEHALFVRHDVTQAADWARVVELGEAQFGKINVLINNAGVAGTALVPTTQLRQEDFQKVCDINLLGVFLGMKSVLPSMVEVGVGSIVNVSSVAGLVAIPGSNLAYPASKFAVRGMTKAIAIEYGPHNIRCNSIHPGYINSPMMSKGSADGGSEATRLIPLT